jgi:hypothetical protein
MTKASKASLRRRSRSKALASTAVRMETAAITVKFNMGLLSVSNYRRESS